jgi:hypothetical protein
MSEVPTDGEVWVHCASGYRASIAASLLARAGRTPVLIDDSDQRLEALGFELDRVPPRRLLMPMGFAAILGGTLTLVASGPLILLNDLLASSASGLDVEIAPYGLFAPTLVGLALLRAGSRCSRSPGGGCCPSPTTTWGPRPRRCPT